MNQELLEILRRIEFQTLLSAKQILNFEDVMFLTGLSKSHLYKLTSSHLIPHYKPMGKQIYFDRLEIEAWLKRNRVNAVDEVEEKAVNYLVTRNMREYGKKC
ncbi:helix-turn-helix transcriptional regulator [Parabacteroides faecis]|uniref:helix-turn-helix transcriptional regulator n=1 Tax=Parabacteroides faecis TaxID=1217282 RepID=UPI0035222540